VACGEISIDERLTGFLSWKSLLEVTCLDLLHNSQHIWSHHHACHCHYFLDRALKLLVTISDNPSAKLVLPGLPIACLAGMEPMLSFCLLVHSRHC
jgi:hypothetical protein